MPDARQQFAVFIATTQGPVRVQHIDYEEDGVLSHIGVEGSTRPEPITRDYRHFVDRSSGLVARRIGHDAFRISLSAGIEQGHSWQAGMMVAHILKDKGQLAEGDGLDGVDKILWLTGEVRAGEKLAGVQEVARKFDRSGDLFQDAMEAGLPVFCFAPKENAGDIPEDLPVHVSADSATDIPFIEHAVLSAAASSGKNKNAAAGKTAPASKGRPVVMAFAGAALAAAVLVIWKPEILGLTPKDPVDPPVIIKVTTPDLPEPEAPATVEGTNTEAAQQPAEEATPEPEPQEPPQEDIVTELPEEVITPREPVDVPAPEPEEPATTTEQITTEQPPEQPVDQEPVKTEETAIIDDPKPVKRIKAAPLFTGNAWYAHVGKGCRDGNLHRVPVLMRDASRFRKGNLERLCGISFVFDQPAPGSDLTVLAVTGKQLRVIGELDGNKIRVPAPRNIKRPRLYSLVVLASPESAIEEGRQALRAFLRKSRFDDRRPDWISLAQDLALDGHHLSVISQRLVPEKKF